MDEEEKEIKALDEKDIALLKSYGQGQYTKALKVSRGIIRVHFTFRKESGKNLEPVQLSFQAVETDIVEISKRVNELAGIKVPTHNNTPIFTDARSSNK